MENAKSIIDIEVKDGDFRRFMDLFEKYKAALGEMPKARKVDEKASEGAAKVDGKRASIMSDVTASLAAHAKLISEISQKTRTLNEMDARSAYHQQQADKLHAAATDRENKALAKREKRIRSIASTFSSIAGTSAGIGLNVAKWGIGAGLAAFGGGLFGMGALGRSATSDRSTARGYGVSAGALRAWRNDFAPYGNPDALLGAASNAYSDPASRAMFMRAGVSSEVIRSGNTAQIAHQGLAGLADFWNKHQGPNGQQIWNAYGFNNVMGFNQMRQFAGASPAERQRMFSNINRDTQKFGNTDATLARWQEFTQQISAAGIEIKSVFLDGLKGLTGPLRDFSKSIVGLIRTFMESGGFRDIIGIVSRGFNDLSKSLRDGSLQKGFSELVQTLTKFVKSGDFKNDIEILFAGLHKLAGILGVFVGPKKSPIAGGVAGGAGAGAIAGATVGTAFGPGGTLVGGVAGAILGGAGGGLWSGYGNWKKDNATGTLHRLSSSDVGIEKSIEQRAIKLGIDPATAKYLAAIGLVESHGNPNARSASGAMGLMQFMPATAKQYGVSNPYDANQSLLGASRYVAHLSKVFNGDTTKMTAAYNYGEGNIGSLVSQYGEHWAQHLTADETLKYVPKVYNAYSQNGGMSININNNTGGSATVTARMAAAQ